jgi:hypothetical protein
LIVDKRKSLRFFNLRRAFNMHPSLVPSSRKSAENPGANAFNNYEADLALSWK